MWLRSLMRIEKRIVHHCLIFLLADSYPASLSFHIWISEWRLRKRSNKSTLISLSISASILTIEEKTRKTQRKVQTTWSAPKTGQEVNLHPTTHHTGQPFLQNLRNRDWTPNWACWSMTSWWTDLRCWLAGETHLFHLHHLRPLHKNLGIAAIAACLCSSVTVLAHFHVQIKSSYSLEALLFSSAWLIGQSHDWPNLCFTAMPN